MIKSPEAVQTFIDALNELNIPYIVTGSLVSNTYGKPRVTYDADFVISIREADLARIDGALGQTFKRDAQMSFETVTGKTQHKFLHVPSGFQIEAFELSADAHDQDRFARRRQVPFADLEVFFPTPEDVVVQKVRWLSRADRAKDRRDVLFVIQRQQKSLDWPYIERWCREHGTLELLNELRAEVEHPTAEWDPL